MGPHGLVLIRLVFGIYPGITELDTMSLLITQRGIAIKKTMDELQKCTTSQKGNGALNT